MNVLRPAYPEARPPDGGRPDATYLPVNHPGVVCAHCGVKAWTVYPGVKCLWCHDEERA